MRERELKPTNPGLSQGGGTSLPMRERELKPADFNLMVVGSWSLPMRERELKRPVLTVGVSDVAKSLPMRERELKQDYLGEARARQEVAPHAGA